jgi:hypothetical protein
VGILDVRRCLPVKISAVCQSKVTILPLSRQHQELQGCYPTALAAASSHLHPGRVLLVDDVQSPAGGAAAGLPTGPLYLSDAMTTFQAVFQLMPRCWRRSAHS